MATGGRAFSTADHSAYRRAFGENLTVLRKLAGFDTQPALAAALGGSPSAFSIGRWERGMRLPDAHEIDRLAAVLDVSPDDLVRPEPLPEDARALLRRGAVAVDRSLLRVRANT